VLTYIINFITQSLVFCCLDIQRYTSIHMYVALCYYAPSSFL